MRIPLFKDHPSFPRPRHGPLLGRSVLVVVAPTECDARGVRAVWRALHPLGVRVGLTQETHGESRGQDGTPLFPDCLLISVTPDGWDALIFAGGRGARRVAEDPLAREVAQRFSAAGKIVAAFGEGRRVLTAAHVEGLVSDKPRALAAPLVAQLAPPPQAGWGTAGVAVDGGMRTPMRLGDLPSARAPSQPPATDVPSPPTIPPQ